MSEPAAILLASAQSHKLHQLLQTHLKQPTPAIDTLGDSTRLFSQLAQKSYALLVMDLSLLSNDLSPTQIKVATPHTALLLLAPQAQRQQAVEQLQHGTDDYLLLPLNNGEFVFKVQHLLEFQALKQNSPSSVPPATGEDELLMLDQATQEIIHTLQLDEALKIVLAKARQVTAADLAKIYLTDQRGNVLKERSLTKTSPLAGNPREDHLLFTLAQQAALTQKVRSQQKTTGHAWLHQTIESALVIPMITREKLIGVMALGSTRPSVFSEHHVRWLSVFCNQAAIAIENARLFQDLSSAYVDLAQSREEILRSRNTLQVVFDAITDGLYILDQTLTINALNQVEAERQGYNPRELVGTSYLSLGWPQAAPDLLDKIKESLETGRETTWISPKNESVPYLKDREFRIYPIQDRLAQIEQVIVFAQDVSERRRWQASLFRSANLAAVGQLAGSVAHQINNPLTVTMTNSQLILLDADPQSETHDLAAGIFKAGERIQHIITNLLEFSNQEQYFFVQTDLVGTIEGALALVIRSIKKARIKLVKNYQVQPMLSASVSHLKLVWVNLLLNARDAVIDSADHPQITIATGPVSDREVRVTITDNGVGIKESDFEQLFRPFFTTKPVGKALGLGLYSAHAIIERHQGQIKAFSEPGVATTFEVILPLDNPRDL